MDIEDDNTLSHQSVQATTTTLNPNTLLQAIQKSLSADHQRREHATQLLKDWQNQEGYHLILHSICTRTELPNDCRLQAILQLKHACEKNWRTGSQNLILDQEKNQLRNAFLQSGIHEPDRVIALHTSIIVAKISRLDFPTKWPNLLSGLIASIRQFSSSDYEHQYPLQLRRALLLLLAVSKELSATKIGIARPKLVAYAPELLVLCGSIYFKSLQSHLLQEVIQDPSKLHVLELASEQALFSIKIIRKIFYVLDTIRDVEAASQFWKQSLTSFQSILNLVLSSSRSNIHSSQPVYLHKTLRQIAKLHTQVAKSKPTDFALLEENEFQVTKLHCQFVRIYAQWCAKTRGAQHIEAPILSLEDLDDSQTQLIDRLALQGLTLLRACVRICVLPGKGLKYRTDEEKALDHKAQEEMQKVIFNETAVTRLVNQIIVDIMPLSPDDLQAWENDPEEWENKEELDTEDYDFASRPCAEKLLLDLIMHVKGTSTRELLKLANEVTSAECEDVLRKDSVYCAIGHAAPFLQQTLDWYKFMQENLIPEMQNLNQSWKIIRRRASILVHKWAVIFSDSKHVALYYQIYQYLLNRKDPMNDKVVRLSAARNIYSSIDAWDATVEDFLPYSNDIMSELVNLIQEAELSQTRLSILQSLTACVNRLGHHVSHFVDGLLGFFPYLWTDGDNNNLLRQQMLSMLSSLLNALGEKSMVVHEVVLEFLYLTVPFNSPLFEALNEESLDLWNNMVRNTPTLQNQKSYHIKFIPLVFLLMPLIVNGIEPERVKEIVESYIVLIPDVLLSPPTLNEIFDSYLAYLKRGSKNSMDHMTDILTVAWRTTSAVRQQLGTQELLIQLVNTGILNIIIEALKNARIALETKETNRHRSIQGGTKSRCFMVISYAAYNCPDLFVNALQQCPAITTKITEGSNQGVMKGSEADWLIDEWLSNVEDYADLDQRKLSALAMARLLENTPVLLLPHMQRLLDFWTRCFDELQSETEDGVPITDCLVWANKPDLPNEAIVEPITCHEKRMKQLDRIDCIHSIDLTQVVKQSLTNVTSTHGGWQKFRQEVLANIDSDVIERFEQTGIM